MKKSMRLWVLPAFMLFGGVAQAYDAELAATLHEQVTGKLTQAALASGNAKIGADKALEMLAKKQPVLLLDVRTAAERQVLAFSHPDAVHVPLDQLFQKQSLDRLPTDRPVLVICHTGPRSFGATMLLRSIGFENARWVGGGTVAIARQLTPKTAP